MQLLSSPMRSALIWSTAGLAAVAAVLLCTATVTAPAAAPGPASTANDVRRDATVAAIETVMPSVVNLATETIIERHDWYEELYRRFYGLNIQPRQEKSMSLGSGVIVDEEGYVLTNFHVVRRASRIQVKLWDGRTYDAVALVATEGSDVALLRLRAKPGEKFQAIKFAKDDDLLLGETVLALGNPFGLGGSVTRGILSSKNRRPSTGNEPLDIEDWLQTDAAINPGNSGGPLVNLKGELIGLNVAVNTEQGGQRGMGVGFSIPVKQVAAALTKFFAPEVTHNLWFGGRVQNASGVLMVTSVQAGSPAARSGLKEKDVVKEVNGQPAGNLITFNRLLGAGGSKPVRVAVQRDGTNRTLTIQMISFTDLIRQRLGLRLIEPTAETAQQLGINPGEGLFVAEVEPDGPGAKAGVQDGYYVVGANGTAAREVRVLGEQLTEKKAGEAVQLTIAAPQRLPNGLYGVRRGVVQLKTR
jgi:S1-C subfamily serine protease